MVPFHAFRCFSVFFPGRQGQNSRLHTSKSLVSYDSPSPKRADLQFEAWDRIPRPFPLQFLRRANDEHSNAPRWACPEQLSKSPGHVPTIQRHNRSTANKPRAHWLWAVSQLRFQAHRDAMVRFFMSLPYAIFANTSTGEKIANLPVFTG